MSGAMSLPALAAESKPVFACVACDQTGTGLSPVLRAFGDALPFDLFRCPRCGTVQQFPRQPPGRLTALYAGDYYVFQETDAQRWARAVQQYILHLRPWESRGARLLDLGCAQGHLAALARARGWQVTGIDLSAEAVSFASTRFGLDVRAGTLSCHRGTLPRFDVVLLGDVLEHVPFPAGLLREVRGVLTPGGVVCIDTPNWGGRWRRWGGKRWLGLNRFHVNFFDAEALAHLLGACGFADVRAGSYTHYRYESWAVRPEVQAWMHRLPGFLAWRVGRLLSRIGRGSPWRSLRDHPLNDLASAEKRVQHFEKLDPASLLREAAVADNLAVHAIRA